MASDSTMKERLRYALKRAECTQNELAEMLGITYQTMSIKINGKKDFTRDEISSIAIILGLSDVEIIAIFFDDVAKRRITSSQPEPTVSNQNVGSTETHRPVVQGVGMIESAVQEGIAEENKRWNELYNRGLISEPKSVSSSIASNTNSVRTYL